MSARPRRPVSFELVMFVLSLAIIPATVVFAVTFHGNGATAARRTPAADTGPVECPTDAGLPSPINNKGAVAASGRTYQIQAGDFFFSPTCVVRAKNGFVTLRVTNTGQALHNVKIADQGIDEDVQAGKSIDVKVRLDGLPVVYVCKYHRTSGMVAAIIPTP